MKIFYFARIREMIGHGEEEITLPDNIRTIAELMDWLKTRGGGYRLAMSDETLCIARDQEFAAPDDPLNGAQEIAFFPPMTGG